MLLHDSSSMGVLTDSADLKYYGMIITGME